MSLGPSAELDPAKPSTVSERLSERRQLTVMFCDLVESTSLSARLDPEELHDIIGRYQHACTEVIERYDGHIAQYLGDGILVYFGYPRAHEDDAQRATHAGLAICEAMARLNDEEIEDRYSLRLAIRIGIHTGPVVTGKVGKGRRQERLAMGQAPNIAARLQGLAEPDMIVLSGTTYQLVASEFVCRPLGSHPLKGFSEPVHTYHALRPSNRHQDSEAVSDSKQILSIGRASELNLLVDAFQEAVDGVGQVVFLKGDAGIGKTRLINALKLKLGGRTEDWRSGRASPYFRNTALYPFAEHVLYSSRIQQDDSPTRRLDCLEALLKRSQMPLEENLALLAELLSVPLSKAYSPLDWSPERRKAETQRLLLDLLLHPVGSRPVVVLFEDLHWVDPSTLDLLGRLVELAPGSRALVILAFRPEFEPPWPTNPDTKTISLTPLDAEEVEQLIGSISKKPLPAEVIEQITDKTDGVPLFVEELTKTVLESGLLRERDTAYELNKAMPSLEIPTTIQGSLMARLDRLPNVRAVAQLASTLGREFSFDMMLAISSTAEEPLQQHLQELVDAQILFMKIRGSRTIYSFKHALIQEAAYESLLKSTQRDYHQRVAEALEYGFPQIVETQPELLGHHFVQAGLHESALDYWLDAGKRGLERSAHLEAIDHLQNGLSALGYVGHSAERDQQELEIQTLLGTANLIKSYGAPEVESAFARARILSHKVGGNPQLFQVFFGLHAYYLVRAELAKSEEMAEKLLELGESLGDTTLLIAGNTARGSVQFYRGDPQKCADMMEKAITLDSPNLQRSTKLTGQDLGVVARVFSGLTWWFLGYPDRAGKLCRESISLAKEISHPNSLAFALHFSALVYQLRGERQAMQQLLAELLPLCQEQNLFYWLAIGQTQLEWVSAATPEQGREALSSMRKTFQGFVAYGALNGQTHQLGLMVDLALQSGAYVEARELLDEAYLAITRYQEIHYQAELERLQGELLLATSKDGADGAAQTQEAEHCFQRALGIAKKQKALSLELRIATSLALLWQRQGKIVEARNLLEATYGCFTEGFDTPDLLKAKDLIASLSKS